MPAWQRRVRGPRGSHRRCESERACQPSGWLPSGNPVRRRVRPDVASGPTRPSRPTVLCAGRETHRATDVLPDDPALRARRSGRARAAGAPPSGAGRVLPPPEACPWICLHGGSRSRRHCWSTTRSETTIATMRIPSYWVTTVPPHLNVGAQYSGMDDHVEGSRGCVDFDPHVRHAHDRRLRICSFSLIRRHAGSHISSAPVEHFSYYWRPYFGISAPLTHLRERSSVVVPHIKRAG